jgi:hypothetical protein
LALARFADHGREAPDGKAEQTVSEEAPTFTANG